MSAVAGAAPPVRPLVSHADLDALGDRLARDTGARLLQALASSASQMDRTLSRAIETVEGRVASQVAQQLAEARDAAARVEASNSAAHARIEEVVSRVQQLGEEQRAARDTSVSTDHGPRPLTPGGALSSDSVGCDGAPRPVEPPATGHRSLPAPTRSETHEPPLGRSSEPFSISDRPPPAQATETATDHVRYIQQDVRHDIAGCNHPARGHALGSPPTGWHASGPNPLSDHGAPPIPTAAQPESRGSSDDPYNRFCARPSARGMDDDRGGRPTFREPPHSAAGSAYGRSPSREPPQGQNDGPPGQFSQGGPMRGGLGESPRVSSGGRSERPASRLSSVPAQDRPAGSAGSDLAVLLITATEQVDTEDSTVAACGAAFYAWSKSPREASSEIDQALFSLPVATLDSLEQITRLLDADLGHGGCRETWCEFNPPVDFRGSRYMGILRAHVTIPVRTRLNDVLQRQAGHQLSRYVELTRIERCVHLHEAYRAAMAAQETSEFMGKVIASTLARALATDPYIAAAFRPRDHAGRDGGDRYPSHGHVVERSSSHAGHKRELWAKSAVADIAAFLGPMEEGTSIRAHHHRIITTLHSLGNSLIPQMLEERGHFFVVMQAIMDTHRRNPECAAMLASATHAQAIQSSIEHAYQVNEADFADARREPSNRTYQSRIRDIIAEVLADVRGHAKNSTRQGVTIEEATLLTHRIATISAESGYAFAREGDRLYSGFNQMWGDRLTQTLSADGALTQLLPTFVRRLPDFMRVMAIKFWSERVTTLFTTKRDSLPPRMLQRLQGALGGTSALLRERVRTDPTQERGHEAFFDLLRNEASLSQSLGRIHSPSDLHFVAPTGLLAIYWSCMIAELTADGPSVAPRTGDVFAIEEVEDEVDADTYAVEARGGARPRRAPFQRSASPASGRSSPLPSVPAANDAGGDDPGTTSIVPRPGRRPNTGQALDRFERQTDKVTVSIGKDLEKVNTRLDKLAQTVDKVQADLTIQKDRGSEQLAHTAKTLEKILANIAQQSTSLSSASAIDAGAAAIGAMSRSPAGAPPRELHAVPVDVEPPDRSVANLAMVASGMDQMETIPDQDHQEACLYFTSVLGLTESAPDDVLLCHAEALHNCALGAPDGGPTPSLLAAISPGVPGRRPPPTDAQGYKLSDKPWNRFDAFNVDVKKMYATRGVTNQSQFDEVRSATCKNCDPMSIMMPHREGHCPLTSPLAATVRKCWARLERHVHSLA